MSAPLLPSQCSSCRHLHGLTEIAPAGDVRGESRVVPYCSAFLGGIPEDIQDGSFDHIFPHDGDNGIRFDPYPPLSLVPSP